MDNRQLLTVPDVAASLHVAPETVREWLRRGDMHGYNLGGRSGWRIPAGEIERFLETRVGGPEHGALPDGPEAEVQ